MNREHFVAATLFTTVLLTLVFVPLARQQGGSTYDPWLDYNEDGRIDVNELQPLGQAYGTLGDSTKNMNITNWPLDAVGNIRVLNEVRILNRQLANNITIPTYGIHHFYVDVSGYKTVYVAVKYEGGIGQIMMTIWFVVGGISVYTGRYVVVNGATSTAYNMSSVIGPELDIFVFENTGFGGASVSVSMYAATT